MSSTYVNISFQSASADPVAKVALKYLPHLVDKNNYNALGEVFLRHLSKRSGKIAGEEGGLFVWSYTMDTPDVDDFVDKLHNFWLELLLTTDLDDGLRYTDRVIILYQHGFSHCIQGVEIRFSEKQVEQLPFAHEIDRSTFDNLVEADFRLKISKFDLPVAWVDSYG